MNIVTNKNSFGHCIINKKYKFFRNVIKCDCTYGLRDVITVNNNLGDLQ